jgi:NADPH-dependent curcumin reductase CurA
MILFGHIQKKNRADRGMIDKTRTILLKSRPTREISVDNFTFSELTLPDPAEGEVLVELEYLSVDPYMRNRMNDTKSYVEPYTLDQPVTGNAVAKVLDSKSPHFRPGDRVTGVMPWQEYAVMAGRDLVRIGYEDVPCTAYLGILGLTGLTAYFGLLAIGKPVSGETVVISGAAGAVGSVAGQIARIKGSHVIGIAGTDQKCSYLTGTLGFNDAINYRSRPNIRKALRTACPAGVDVYFDNVGGEISDSVLFYLNDYARIVLCGQIALYNTNRLIMGPRLQAQLIIHRALMQGFIVHDYNDRFEEARRQLHEWIMEGRLSDRETITEGFNNLPVALIGLFNGENTGKQIVKI